MELSADGLLKSAAEVPINGVMFGQPLSRTDGVSMNDVSSGREVPAGYVLYELPTLTLQRPIRPATTFLVLMVLLQVMLPYLLLVYSLVAESWPTWTFHPLWFLAWAVLNAAAFIWWSRRIVANGRLLGATTWLRTHYLAAYLLAVAGSSMLRFEPLVHVPAQILVIGASFVVWSSLWTVSDAAPVRRVNVLVVIKTVALAAVSVMSTIFWSFERFDVGLLSSLLFVEIVDFAHVALTIAVVLGIWIKQKRRLAVFAPTSS